MYSAHVWSLLFIVAQQVLNEIGMISEIFFLCAEVRLVFLVWQLALHGELFSIQIGLLLIWDSIHFMNNQMSKGHNFTLRNE